jgi:hypothetical protein
MKEQIEKIDKEVKEVKVLLEKLLEILRRD